jgi:hypothetical protein
MVKIPRVHLREIVTMNCLQSQRHCVRRPSSLSHTQSIALSLRAATLTGLSVVIVYVSSPSVSASCVLEGERQGTHTHVVKYP